MLNFQLSMFQDYKPGNAFTVTQSCQKGHENRKAMKTYNDAKTKAMDKPKKKAKQ